MSDGQRHDGLNELERLLGGLRPAPADVKPAAVHYQAGRRVERRRLWRVATLAGLLGVAVGALLSYPALHWLTPPAERVVYVRLPADVQPAPDPPRVAPTPDQSSPTPSLPHRDEVARSAPFWPESDAGYLGLRNRVVRWGVGVLPDVGVEDGPRVTSPTLLQMYADLADKGEAF